MMMILPTPKFYGNTEDDAHCNPAVWRMILETFFPEQSWPFEKIDAIIRKEQGKWTWIQTFYDAATAAGCRLHIINTFDDSRFLNETWDYMRERSGDAVTKAQMAHCPDIDFVLEAMKKSLANPNITREVRPAKVSDIAYHLSQGGLVSCVVNLRFLNNLEGYASHSVLVYGLDNKNIYYHDPGNPPIAERTTPIEVFEKAMYVPTAETANIRIFYKRA